MRGLALVLLMSLPALPAQAPWSPEDYARTAWPGEARLSADGRRLYFVANEPDLKANTSRDRIWTVDLGAGAARPASAGLRVSRCPRPGPDGSLAFLGARTGKDAEDDRLQVYLRTRTGTRALTRRENGVKGLEWRDAGHLLLAMEPDPDAEERRLKAAKDDSVAVDDEARARPVQLWELALAGGALRRISAGRDRVGPFAVSPDGRWAVARHELGTRWEYDQKVAPATRVWDLRRGTAAEVATGPQRVPDGFRWSPDSRTFFATYRRISHPYISHSGVAAAFRAAAPGWRPEPLPLDWERGLGPSLQPVAGGFLANLEDGLVRKAARIAFDGRTTRLGNPPEGNPEQVLAGAGGRDGAALLSSASRPAQWYRVTFGDTALAVRRRLSDLNPHLAGKAFARVEPYRVTGAEGPVEGLLYYPRDYRPGRAYPLVLNPHGGPAMHDRDEWAEAFDHPAQLHAQEGAFVLNLNYSGSTGYGLAFAERLMGRYLGPELVDLAQAVQDLVARGLADPGRIGCTGWSNGAILGWALAAEAPFRIRAAALGAGDVNFTSDWGNCSFGESYDTYYLGASLVDDPDAYWRRSTIRRLAQVRSAVLIFHGDKDRVVPTGQGWEAFRFLQQAGKAPVRFVLFPGEEHELRQPAHNLRKFQEELAWFRNYLY